MARSIVRTASIFVMWAVITWMALGDTDHNKSDTLDLLKLLPHTRAASTGGTPRRLLAGSSCADNLTSVAAALPNTSTWPQYWTDLGLDSALDNPEFSATLLVPQDHSAIIREESGPSILFNILPGEYCPDELAALGSSNTLLGEALDADMPMDFATDTQGRLVAIGQFNNATVLSTTFACNSIILVTDVPLQPGLPPPGAGRVPDPPQLPKQTKPIRNLTCDSGGSTAGESAAAVSPPLAIKPVALPVMPPAEAPAAAPSSTSSGSSSSTNLGLIVGLSVGLGVAALLAAAAGAVLLRRRRRQQQHLQQERQLVDIYIGGMMGAEGGAQNVAVRWPLSPVIAQLSIGTIPASELLSVGYAAEDQAHFTSRVVSSAGGDAADPPAQSQPRRGSPASKPSSRADSQMSRLNSSAATLMDALELDPADVAIDVDAYGAPVRLGRGAFGEVLRGVLRGVQPAAVKVLTTRAGDDAEAALLREAAILRHVSRDRNVVQLYGTCRTPDGRLLLVTELMEGGDLREALNRDEEGLLHWQRAGKGIALDIARGVAALHSHNVVHRDLKSKNVLLSASLVAKVADVGIAAVHSQGYLTAGAGHMVGTLAWSAPELLLNYRCSDKVDIYSLGIVLWELATGQVPTRGFTAPPEPSDRCPEGLTTLIKQCTCVKPGDRPTAKQVYDRLLRIPPVLPPRRPT